MEEAIKIKEKNGGKIIALTIGPADAKELIKELLAMGSDEGILVTAPEKMDYHVTATLLSEAIKKIGEYELILCGEASVDLFSGQIGPRIAGLLNIPQITYAQSIIAEKDKITAERNMSENAVTSESTFPVVVTVTKEINEPRLPSLMQILGAANKPIQEWTADSLISGLNPLVETIDLKGVPMERKNIIYKDDLDESIKQLVDSLAKEGVLRG
jgi:electron transfer flavoprotein beta subunit